MVEEGLFEVSGAEHRETLDGDRSSLKQFALGRAVAEERALDDVVARLRLAGGFGLRLPLRFLLPLPLFPVVEALGDF